MTWKVPLFAPQVGDAEIAAVTEVLRAGHLSAGASVERFEVAFAAASGHRQAVMVVNGTAALYLAIEALGIGSGDEVIIPSLTFVATAACVAIHGATPVFADIVAPETPLIDPAVVESLISPRTRAVIAVHYAGYPAAIGRLRELCDRHGLALIEDAAHAPLVELADAEGRTGSLADVACFSFFATKNIAAGEGGLLLARDPEIRSRLATARSHGLTLDARARYQTDLPDYDVHGPGLNFRSTEIAGALALAQLARQKEDRRRRRMLVKRYHAALENSAIVPAFRRQACDSAHHLLPVLLPDPARRLSIRKAMHAKGVQTGVHYPPVHLLTYYRDRFNGREGLLPMTEAACGRLVTLPLNTKMSEADVDLVCDRLLETVRGDSLALS